MTETIAIGGLTLEFLYDKEQTDGGLDMFRMTVQPKARVPIPHYHESWDETIYGLSGTLVWRVGNEDVFLSSGESIFIKRGVVHSFRNDSEAPATALCVLTPGVLGPQYFRDMAALLADGPPDPAKMKEIMARHGLVVG